MITPKQPGWMEEVDKAIESYKPDSWKSYTIGDPGSRHRNTRGAWTTSR